MPRVLVIDDDVKQCRLLAGLLTEAGYEVVVANDGRQGLSAQRDRPVDLVITDLVMPGMNGVEFMAELRREFPILPVIVMTAGGLRVAGDSMELVVSLGASAALTKPFGKEELLNSVRAALQG